MIISNAATKKEFISVKELAKVLEKSERTIQRWCDKDKVQYRIVKGNGGNQYEILVTSLSNTIQNSINTLCCGSSSYININTQNIEHNSTATFSSISSVNKNISCGDNLSEIKKIPSTSVPTFPLNQNYTHNNHEICDSWIDDHKGIAISSDIENTLVSFGLKSNGCTVIIPETEKEKALYKIDLINLWKSYRNEKKSKVKADKNFEKVFNAGLLSKTLHDEIGNISIRTIYRWNKDYELSKYDWKSLVNNYNYGCESQFSSTMNDIERYTLLKYMLHQNKISLGRAYEYIKLELRQKGITNISSYATYRRAWEYVCRNHSEKVAYARFGMKNMLDTQSPYIMRNWGKLNFGDMIVGDGHTLDFMLQNPFTGKPCRATLIGFLDVASGDLVGFDVMLTENTQAIASALRNAILYMGKFPKVVQLDNGRAFKGKYFTSTKDFDECGIQGLYASLGIETYFSRAYNGRAKIIERFFKELTESHAKTWGSYIGNNIANKPAYTMRNEKFHRELQGGDCPTIEDVKTAFTAWLECVYRQRPCRNDKNMTIAEYVKNGRGSGIDTDKLDDLMLATDERKIGRNGIRIFDAFYWSDKLFGLNDKCIIKYNFFDLSYVKVYSTKGEYICKAERSEAVHPVAKLLGSPKDYEEYKAQLRSKDKLIKERLKPLKKQLKNMYPSVPTKKYDSTPIKPVETEEQYKITYAEDNNIINVEKETYNVDYSDFDIGENKQYNI